MIQEESERNSENDQPAADEASEDAPAAQVEDPTKLEQSGDESAEASGQKGRKKKGS